MNDTATVIDHPAEGGTFLERLSPFLTTIGEEGANFTPEATEVEELVKGMPNPVKDESDGVRASALFLHVLEKELERVDSFFQGM